MPTFCAIIARNRPSDEDCKTLQDFTGRTTQIIFAFDLVHIADKLDRKLHECDHIEINHSKYQFADVTCELDASNFSQTAKTDEISGDISNIRDITAIELFEKLGGNKSAYRNMPESLLTYKFVKWLNKQHPEIKTQSAKIMTGKQFNKLFPGPKTTLINHNTIRYMAKNSPKIGLNVCADFSPVADPNYFNVNRCNGLYCVETNELSVWADYLHMHLYASAEIPADATVVIMHTHRGMKYKSSHMILGEFQTISE